MTHTDEQLVSEAASLAGDSTIPADVRLMQLRELIGKDMRPRWRVTTTVDKYNGEWTAEQIASGEAAHAFDDRVETHGNLLTIGGVSALWERLIGTGVTAYSNATAVLGVGDSTTAAADTQTDLQAASNKTYKGMDSTYPSHTDSTSNSAAKTITFRATFGTSDANHRWREWIVGNGTTTAGRTLNRKVEDLDGGSAKTSAQSWQLTITIALA